jgi:hypothetical protein
MLLGHLLAFVYFLTASQVTKVQLAFKDESFGIWLSGLNQKLKDGV